MLKKKIYQLLIIVFLPVMIILSNLLLLAYSNSTYKSIYDKENTYQNFQSTTVVKNATKELIGYFRGQNNLEDKFFSIQAKVHLRDVKSLLRLASLINYFSVFVLTIMTFFLIKYKNLKLLKRLIIIGSLTTLFIVIFIGISIILNFNFLFIKFHELLFRNNFWLFDPSDNLIQLFPQEFFIAFTFKLLINITLTAFAFILAAMLFIKGDKPSG